MFGMPNAEKNVSKFQNVIGNNRCLLTSKTEVISTAIYSSKYVHTCPCKYQEKIVKSKQNSEKF